jgi:hypothetical protein
MNADKLSFAHRVLLTPESEQIAVRFTVAAYARFNESIDAQLEQLEIRFAGPRLKGLSAALGLDRQRV